MYRVIRSRLHAPARVVPSAFGPPQQMVEADASKIPRTMLESIAVSVHHKRSAEQDPHVLAGWLPATVRIQPATVRGIREHGHASRKEEIT